MFIPCEGIELPYTWTFFGYGILGIATFAAWCRKKKMGLKRIEGFYPIMKLDTVCGLTFFLLLCGLTVILAYFGETYFIYGNF